MARPSRLSSLSFDDLVKLRDDVAAILSRHAGELKRQLSALVGDQGKPRPGRPRTRRSKLAGRKVAPKYRNPKTGETWSGRGAMAGWMAAAVKAGKKRDHFLIVRAGKRRKARR
jgi:DNA-binding protein H-NS